MPLTVVELTILGYTHETLSDKEGTTMCMLFLQPFLLNSVIGLLIKVSVHLLLLDWPNTTFASFLARPWPFSSTALPAAHLLYTSILHHAAFPFAAPENVLLTRKELYMGLVMMTKHQHEIIGGFASQKDIVRPRNETDRRRVFFRSLAKPDQNTMSDDKTDEISAYSEDNIDLLDVLAHTQPRARGLPDVPEVFFRSLVQELPCSRYSLSDLQIPSHDFSNLLEFLLPYIFHEPYHFVSMHPQQEQDITAVSQCILSAFVCVNEEGIRWQNFECVVSNIMVSL